jgi:hypothetical protein
VPPLSPYRAPGDEYGRGVDALARAFYAAHRSLHTRSKREYWERLWDSGQLEKVLVNHYRHVAEVAMMV